MSIHIPKFCGYSLKRNGRNYRHFAEILNNLKRWRKQKSHSNKLSWISISFFSKPETSLKFSSGIRCFIIFCGWVSKAFFTNINFCAIKQNLWMRNTCAQENVYLLSNMKSLRFKACIVNQQGLHCLCLHFWKGFVANLIIVSSHYSKLCLNTKKEKQEGDNKKKRILYGCKLKFAKSRERLRSCCTKKNYKNVQILNVKITSLF